VRAVLVALVATGCFFEPPRPLDPDARGGMNPGDGPDGGLGSANYMFVSSTPFSIAAIPTAAERMMAADAHCQGLAFQAPQASPVRGHYYQAWVSTDLVNAGDRLAMTGARVWLRPDGHLIARTVVDLTDGSLDSAPLFDENVDMVGAGVAVMTGTESSGLYSISNLGCGNGHVEVGLPTAMDGTWTDTGYQTCQTTTLRLYCLGYDVVGQL